MTVALKLPSSLRQSSNSRPAKSKEIDPATQNQMLIKVHNAWNNGAPYAEGANSPRYVGHMLTETPFNLSKKRAKKLVGQWLIDGHVRSEMIDAKSKTRGLKVLEWFD